MTTPKWSETLPTYVISLERSADRRMHFTQEAKSIGLAFEFFNGIDALGIENDFTEIRSAALQTGCRPLSPGEIACAGSHRNVYTRVLLDGSYGCLIFEDDAILEPSLREFVAKLSENAANLASRSLLIHLGGREGFESRRMAISIWARLFRWQAGSLRKVLSSENAIQRACGYFITRAACQEILRREPHISMVADAWDQRLRQGTISELWIAAPPMVSHPKSLDESLIECERLSFVAGHLAGKRPPHPARKLIFLFKRLGRRYLYFPILRLSR